MRSEKRKALIANSLLILTCKCSDKEDYRLEVMLKRQQNYP